MSERKRHDRPVRLKHKGNDHLADLSILESIQAR